MSATPCRAARKDHCDDPSSHASRDGSRGWLRGLLSVPRIEQATRQRSAGTSATSPVHYDSRAVGGDNFGGAFGGRCYDWRNLCRLSAVSVVVLAATRLTHPTDRPN